MTTKIDKDVTSKGCTVHQTLLVHNSRVKNSKKNISSENLESDQMTKRQ